MSARPAPRHAPTASSSRPARLRSVGGIVGGSGRLLRWSTVVFGALAVMLLFGLVAFNAMIVRNQSALDELDSEIAAITHENQVLQFEVAELESPERIRNIAESVLGMVAPEQVTYLHPISQAELAGAADTDTP